MRQRLISCDILLMITRIYIHIYIYKCKLDMCRRGCKLRFEHLFTSEGHRVSRLGLHSCIVHVYIHPGRGDFLAISPPSRHYPFHTRLSPPVRGLKFRAGKLARKLACPRFPKTAPFGKIRLFRIRYREIMGHKEAHDIYPAVNELAGGEGKGGIWRSTTR